MSKEQETKNSQAMEQTTPEEGTKKANSQKDDGRVDYVLPRNILSNEKHQTVILNGRIYQVEAGRRVRIPKGVAEILDHALEQRGVAMDLQDECSIAEK